MNNYNKNGGCDSSTRLKTSWFPHTKDYENFCLINTHTPSYITCPIQGDFLQSFDAHIHQKSVCPECAKEIRNKKNSKFYREMLNINDNRKPTLS